MSGAAGDELSGDQAAPSLEEAALGGENRVTLDGVVATEVLLRVTPAGCRVASFTLAHASAVHDLDPLPRLELNLPVMALGRLADQALALAPGSRVRIQGRLNQKRWTRSGKTRWGAVELVVLDLLPLESEPLV